ncbi:NfeD family protein [Vibrio owensii]|uniref:NfeD family protein n=1 Tax=Vibrio harveyi group TaxID=717610 RepID=UPI003CC68077
MHTFAFILGVVCSVLFLGKLCMMVLGLDTEFEAGEADEGFTVLSINTALGFGMSYGWSWLAFHYKGYEDTTAMIFAIGVATVMTGIFALLLSKLKKIESGEITDTGLEIGQHAQVSIKIPAKNAGSGQIKATIRGANRHVSAFTAEDEDIKPGASVVVESVSGDKVVVALSN